MSRLLDPPLPPTPPLQETPFYGRRYLRRRDADGRETLEEVPLTLEDLLYPQIGDKTPKCPQHQMECSYLANVFRSRFAGDFSVAVLSDCLIDWGIPSQRNHKPDLAVFRNLRVPLDPQLEPFRLIPSGGRVVLVIEVVSPDCRDNDVVRKPEDYHRLDIPLYVLIDQQRERGPRQLHGYRWTPAGYEELPLDAGGRLFVEPVGLLLALEDGWIACYDARSEMRIGDYQEISQALQEEASARRAAEQYAAAQQARADAEQIRADAEHARAETFEQRLRELEAELRRLRGET
jgi:colicin import membrane protein